MLTLELVIDDKPLKEIIGSLYYPDCPNKFSVLPADSLGWVYEQFLGKVIRLTAGHQAKVEEKPEVRKAGGVYYTPTYIVKNTVGKQRESGPPPRLTTVCRYSGLMHPVSTQSHPASTDTWRRVGVHNVTEVTRGGRVVDSRERRQPWQN